MQRPPRPRRGIHVTLVAERRAGEASPAAAGMLAPGVEHATGPAHAFGIAARDRYPEFLAELERVTGLSVPLDRKGILQVAATSRGRGPTASGRRRRRPLADAGRTAEDWNRR